MFSEELDKARLQLAESQTKASQLERDQERVNDEKRNALSDAVTVAADTPRFALTGY